MKPDDTLRRYLNILRCPLTLGPLTALSSEELAAVNDACRSGAVLHHDGEPVVIPLVEAVGTTDRGHVYRVADGIVWLLPDLALVGRAEAAPRMLAGEKRGVQKFYDEVGWVKTSAGVFNDTAAFTDTRGVTENYRRRCNGRIGRLLSGGQFLLDVASGPIPHPEYLEFSERYEVRVCVDFSIRALTEARNKLGERGLYVLGDITRLPFASGSMDAVISLHTIYHVPQAEQSKAIDEVARVTKAGGRAIVVYTWTRSLAMTSVFRARRAVGRVRRFWRSQPHAVAGAEAPPDATLYFHPQDYAWFARDVAARHSVRLRVWSAVNTQFQDRFVTNGVIGRLVIGAVSAVESAFPAWAGRYGQYPMFVVEKPREAKNG